MENPPFGKTGSVEKLVRRVERFWFQPVGCAALGAALRRVLTGALRPPGRAETPERTGAECAAAMGAAATNACEPDMPALAPPPRCACAMNGSVKPRSKTRIVRRMVVIPDEALTVLHCIRRSHLLQRYPQFAVANSARALGFPATRDCAITEGP